MKSYATTTRPRLSAVALLLFIGMAEFVIDFLTGAPV